MPLTFDLTNIKRYKSLWTTIQEGELGYDSSEPRYRLKGEHDTIIMLTMLIGLGTITEDNYTKFYNRVRLYEFVHGNFLLHRTGDKVKPKPITEKMIKRLIGLKTNVSDISKAKFLRRVFKNNFNL